MNRAVRRPIVVHLATSNWPVTPEVAGSSPVAPVKAPANGLLCCQAGRGNRADYTNARSGRVESGQNGAKPPCEATISSRFAPGSRPCANSTFDYINGRRSLPSLPAARSMPRGARYTRRERERPSGSAARARASVIAAWDEARPLFVGEVASGDGARVLFPRVDGERPDGAAAVVVDGDERAAVGSDHGVAGLCAGRGEEARTELLHRRCRPQLRAAVGESGGREHVAVASEGDAADRACGDERRSTDLLSACRVPALHRARPGAAEEGAVGRKGERDVRGSARRQRPLWAARSGIDDEHLSVVETDRDLLAVGRERN